jgi:ArsR family transcriptional regulator, arsenate/arsenite/antimonite-responsive transcriptional repressor
MREYKYFLPIFKALADEHRLKIIEMLSCGEMCACKILKEFEFTQPALSQHMKVLCGSGLVNGAREGAWMHYTLNKDMYIELIEFINYISNNKANYAERLGVKK